MEERYLYRAKRIDNREWISGNLIHTKNGYCICKNPFECMSQYSSVNGESFGFGGFVQVDTSTICQCTGLMDKNGKLIWENNVVTGWFDDKRITGYIKYGSNGIFYIERNGLYGIHLDNSQDWLEVIGNIFDNPELLKGNMMYDKKEIDRLGDCLSRGFASGLTGVKSYISQKMEEYSKQAVDNCYMAQKFENPGMEDGMCAGLQTHNGDGETCETCKNCKLLYLDEYDRNEE